MDERFLETLRATFKVEAEEHLHVMTSGLLDMEKSPAPDAQRTLVEAVFRAAHSLKGAARAVDLTDVESRCQALESTFAAWKQQETTPTAEMLDGVHRLLADITSCLARPVSSRDSSTTSSRPKPPPAPGAARQPVSSPPAAAGDETVRIAVAKLDARLLEAEEMLAAKLTAGQRARDIQNLGRRFAAWRKLWSGIEPDVRAVRQAGDRSRPGIPGHVRPALVRLLEFLDANLEHFEALERDVAALRRAADQDRHLIARLVDDLLDESKRLLLLPFTTVAAPFPKLVRDLCRDQGKEADLVIRGDEVEIDRRILEEMKDPLIHLLRNAVDHGVETPDARQRAGKPSRATITLAVLPVNGNKVELRVSDDGAGIDTEKVKEAAVTRGLLAAGAAHQLDNAAARQLIFETEVSTSPLITRLSGRGLGLAIVREKADKLGGTVSVDSLPGQGTSFSIVLPSALATFRGLLVESAERLFLVPTLHVERVARVAVGDIRTVEGRETISLGGHPVALTRLDDLLELPRVAGTDAPDRVPVLVLVVGDQRIAVVVDAVLDEQEVLVKPLVRPLSRVRNIAGATVLGNGRTVPILNVSDLLKSARKSAGRAPRAAAGARAAGAPPTSVLVVEDSITSRMLIKGILQSAGYKVKTAVDGLEAFTLLRTEPFDLLVSDVEMPRLNGFDLTARIRADRKLAELPVVLVTALETREDRERGIEVGANAYIVKSSFDQSDLLDAVRRLA